MKTFVVAMLLAIAINATTVEKHYHYHLGNNMNPEMMRMMHLMPRDVHHDGAWCRFLCKVRYILPSWSEKKDQCIADCNKADQAKENAENKASVNVSATTKTHGHRRRLRHRKPVSSY